ncbi:hypothetical protein BJX70DRAFT_402508 [Aspergillus crustosus]
MTPPLADVDDTAAFMAVARSFKLDKEYGKPPAASDNASSEQDTSQTPVEAIDEVEVSPSLNNNEFEAPVENEAAESSNDSHEPMIEFEESEVAVSDVNETVASAGTPEVETRADTRILEKPRAYENDREHLTTFPSWGTPAVRNKPAAHIRRVVLKGLPVSWATPDKVLSLVYGGVIESVSITPAGNAHILFCDPDACKAFYKRYPNGIDLDKERKLAVFVDLGEDIDVISSQLSHSLSVGSTRVVRAVGVELDVTMNDLVKIATASSRKVEKIVDAYVPGSPRSVNFCFCSIDDAVRFRAALVRNEDWEQCNVQYATDPCEVATGYHTD